MHDRIEIGDLSADLELYQFINQEIIPGAQVSAARFWQAFADDIKLAILKY